MTVQQQIKDNPQISLEYVICMELFGVCQLLLQIAIDQYKLSKFWDTLWNTFNSGSVCLTSVALVRDIPESSDSASRKETSC